MEKNASLGTPNEESGQLRSWNVDLKKCTGCEECVYACLRELLYFKNNTLYIKNDQLCNGCGDCAAVCAYHAISFA